MDMLTEEGRPMETTMPSMVSDYPSSSLRLAEREVLVKRITRLVKDEYEQRLSSVEENARTALASFGGLNSQFSSLITRDELTLRLGELKSSAPQNQTVPPAVGSEQIPSLIEAAVARLEKRLEERMKELIKDEFELRLHSVAQNAENALTLSTDLNSKLSIFITRDELESCLSELKSSMPKNQTVTPAAGGEQISSDSYVERLENCEWQMNATSEKLKKLEETRLSEISESITAHIEEQAKTNAHLIGYCSSISELLKKSSEEPVKSNKPLEASEVPEIVQCAPAESPPSLVFLSEWLSPEQHSSLLKRAGERDSLALRIIGNLALACSRIQGGGNLENDFTFQEQLEGLAFALPAYCAGDPSGPAEWTAIVERFTKGKFTFDIPRIGAPLSGAFSFPSGSVSVQSIQAWGVFQFVNGDRKIVSKARVNCT